MDTKTHIKSDFSYDIDQYDDSITIYKGDQVIKLTHWEALLLLNILVRNYPN